MAKKIIKPQPISGFPEYTPAVHRVWQSWCDHMRAVFESYGFCGIETPAVEALEVIAAKGEVDKEIYVLERLHRAEGEKDARLGLRFDQTVPLARYVAQHFNDLTFPFKRYQIGRVWRGERPQAGRFREFTQADIDVIGVDNLPLAFDSQPPAIIYEALAGLPGVTGQDVQVRISNRKIVIGLMGALDVADPIVVLRTLDKGEPTGLGEVDALTQVQDLEAVTPRNALMAKGLEELRAVLADLSHLPKGAVVADLSIVRGLDYYTGTVYETFLTGAPELGSICSGGRYDDLAGAYIAKSLPGVGLSIGVSRLFSHLLAQGKLPIGRVSPAEVLVTLPSEGHRAAAQETARALRARGIATEVYHAPHKIGRQIAYAEKRGVPHVWFPDAGGHSVKTLATGTQAPADAATWAPQA